MVQRMASLSLLCVCALHTIGCAPSSFQKGSSSGWKSIALQDDLVSDYDQAWQKVIDTIAREWDIEIMDKNSGYLRTSWQYGISGVSGSLTNRYAGRLTIKFPTVKPPVEKVDLKTDARWLEVDGWTGASYWVNGFDTGYQRDVFGALSGRLGRTAPTD
jgi:hypothetical protein